MAIVPHVTSGLGLRKFQADGFFVNTSVQGNIEARSRNHFCRGKAIGNKCYQCVSVFLP